MGEFDRSVLREEQVDAPRRATLMDYLEVLFRWRKFILINLIVAALLAVGVSLLLPKWYRATASILPPKTPDMLNMMGSAGSMLRNLGPLSKLGGMGQGGGQYNYFAILKSRSTFEEVIRRFDLMTVYDIKDTLMEDAIKELRANTAFETQEDDNINVDVLDKDPQRAAAMANAFVEILNRKSIELAIQEAQSNRLFIEERVQATRDSLRRAEEALRAYQERSGMMITPEQSASATAIAELYGMKARKEIEVAILRRTVSADNELLRQGELELREIQRKLDAIPGAGLQTVRLYRDMITSQKILEFLIPLYEQAKIDEQKNIPVLLVLDKAVPPERRAKPQRALIVLSVTFLIVLLLVVLVYLMEGILRRMVPVTPLQQALHRWAARAARIYRVSLAS